MILMMVRFHVTPEGRERALRAMRDVAPLMRAEPGCVRFEVLEPEDDRDHLWFHEVWTDRTASERDVADRAAPIPTLARAIGTEFASPPSVSTFSIVG
jgi:quinol monooxygenase YgiN